MYKNILVPIVFDHDPSEQEALAIAKTLVAEGGKVTLFHVVEEVAGYVSAQLPKDMMQQATAQAMDKLAVVAQSTSLPVETVVVVGHSSRTILSQAEDMNVDCIIISSHKPGMGDYFIGSTAARVVRHAKCAVHVLR